MGVTSVIRRAKTGSLAAAPWIRSMVERRPARVVAVAGVNRAARIVRTVLAPAISTTSGHGPIKIGATEGCRFQL